MGKLRPDLVTCSLELHVPYRWPEDELACAEEPGHGRTMDQGATGTTTMFTRLFVPSSRTAPMERRQALQYSMAMRAENLTSTRFGGGYAMGLANHNVKKNTPNWQKHLPSINSCGPPALVKHRPTVLDCTVGPM